jgi:hypothetical protein
MCTAASAPSRRSRSSVHSHRIFAAGLGTSNAAHPTRIPAYCDGHIRRPYASEGPPSSWSDQQMNNSNDGQGYIVMCESLLGIEGSSLDTFANRPPALAKITSRSVYIHELAPVYCTVPHNAHKYSPNAHNPVNPAERSARFIRRGVRVEPFSEASAGPTIA